MLRESGTVLIHVQLVCERAPARVRVCVAKVLTRQRESTVLSDDLLLNDTVIPKSKYEPRHELFNNVLCATSKASNLPAHTRSLV